MAGVEEKGWNFEGAAPASPARAKLFTHGGSQAVRLPKAFRFEGGEVAIRKDGDRVILEPVRTVAVTTPEQRRAFWARIDALRGDELLETPPDPPLVDPDHEL
jgi:antitoxin VapB